MDKLRNIRLKLKKETDCKPSLISEISDYILSLEDEVNYYESIFDGSWPTAKEILQNTLRQIKENDERDRIYTDTIPRFSVWSSRSDQSIFALVYGLDGDVNFILIKKDKNQNNPIILTGLVTDKFSNFRTNFELSNRKLLLK